jgi:hypothetical protein
VKKYEEMRRKITATKQMVIRVQLLQRIFPYASFTYKANGIIQPAFKSLHKNERRNNFNGINKIIFNKSLIT